MIDESLSTGDPWPAHYRGLTLHLDSSGDIWWRPYRGEQRLFVEDPPESLVQALLEVKPRGAMFRVTEHQDVIAKIENHEDGTYDPVYVGRLEEPGRLLPDRDDKYPVELHLSELDEGDLWPSIYDGSLYSLSSPDTIWWHDPDSKRRHQVTDGLPHGIAQAIVFQKNGGGSFRITPWGDVITLIGTVPEPEDAVEQFRNLPRPIRNIVQLRNDRGGDMLPIYVGNIGDNRISIEEPRSLTDPLDEGAQQELEDWIRSLGPTSSASRRQVTEEEMAASGLDDDPDGWETDLIEQEAEYERED